MMELKPNKYKYRINNIHIMVSKCAHCNKVKKILIKCMCGNEYCMKHNLPTQHNCKHESCSFLDKMSKEATGAFKKIDKI